jgi:hypothetical protein
VTTGDWRTRWTGEGDLLNKIMAWPNPAFPPLSPPEPQQFPMSPPMELGPSVVDAMRAIVEHLAAAGEPLILAGYSQWDEVDGYRRYSPFDDTLDDVRPVLQELCDELNRGGAHR